jgi:hypothetical protein
MEKCPRPFFPCDRFLRTNVNLSGEDASEPMPMLGMHYQQARAYCTASAFTSRNRIAAFASLTFLPACADSSFRNGYQSS